MPALPHIILNLKLGNPRLWHLGRHGFEWILDPVDWNRLILFNVPEPEVCSENEAETAGFYPVGSFSVPCRLGRVGVFFTPQPICRGKYSQTFKMRTSLRTR